MRRALIVGRFQPPHKGHLYAVRQAARKHDRVILAVGSAQHSHALDNPFTVGERMEMWLAALAAARLSNVHLYALPDLHHHPTWVEHVQTLLPPFDVVVTNNPLTRRLFSQGGYKVVEGPLWRPETCSGTKIRARWAEGEDPSDLLPPAVARVAQRLDAPSRMQHLAREAPGVLGSAR